MQKLTTWLRCLVYRLQTFVNRVQTAVGSHSRLTAGAAPSVSTTLAAFAAALADQLRPMWAELVRLEETVCAQGSDMIAQAQAPVTLLWLEYQLQVVCCHSEPMLEKVRNALLPLEQPNVSLSFLADTSCSLCWVVRLVRV